MYSRQDLGVHVRYNAAFGKMASRINIKKRRRISLRQKIFYKNMEEVENAFKDLKDVEYTDDNGFNKKLVCEIIKNGKKRHLLMYDKDLLLKIKKHDALYDGTFKTRPKIGGIVQTFTLMALLDQQVKQTNL